MILQNHFKNKNFKKKFSDKKCTFRHPQILGRKRLQKYPVLRLLDASL